MKNVWPIRSLDEVLEIQNGYAFDSKDFNPIEGLPLVRIRSLKAGIETETMYTGGYDKKYIVNNGDLLIGMDGEFGCYEWRGGTALLNQRVCRLQGFKNDLLFPRFIHYGVNSYLKAIEEVTSFTTVKHISSKQILNIKFPLPPITEQKRIVAILDQAFESIAKTRAHAEQNLQNARALFESHLHSIDAVKQELGDFVSIRTGKLDANAAVEGGAYPFFTCSRDIYRINHFAFDGEAILLAGNNASGDFNVKHYIGKFNAYQRTYVITVNNENKASYRYLYFQLLAKLKEFKKQSVGSNTKFLKIGMIQGMKIPIPSFTEQKAIVIKLDSLLAETQRLEALYQRKIACLDELKKSLLQRAFAGEL